MPITLVKLQARTYGLAMPSPVRDDCAYIYGAQSGTPGAMYNQAINSSHYLTQEEFSNDDFVLNVSGCIQQEEAASSPPSVTSVSPNSGPVAGGQSVTITGTGFTGATSVKFTSTPATAFSVDSDTQITATSPAHGGGSVNVYVQTPSGTSAAVLADRYRFSTPATITAVAPNTGRSPVGRASPSPGPGSPARRR